MFVERQFGVLEVHGQVSCRPGDPGRIRGGLGVEEEHQLRLRILFCDVIEDVTDAHAIIINRNRRAP